ncbi:hypothetical protein BH23CHL7_BH23CHL7_20210 [soil metagenome]
MATLTDAARREWRPQKPRSTRRPPPITDPLLEPFWSGTRVLAHFAVQPDSDAPPRLELLDEWGDDVGRIATAAVDALRQAVMALEAVIDGVLTVQPSIGGDGTALVAEARVPAMGMFVPRAPQVVYERRFARPESEPEIAFVAVDLLSVDGQSLLDLPLLERKRQLESLFVETELLRISPVARPPVGPWLNSWRAAGFAGVMMKAANSRYRPGELTVEWSVVRQLGQRT